MSSRHYLRRLAAIRDQLPAPRPTTVCSVHGQACTSHANLAISVLARQCRAVVAEADRWRAQGRNPLVGMEGPTRYAPDILIAANTDTHTWAMTPCEHRPWGPVDDQDQEQLRELIRAQEEKNAAVEARINAGGTR